MSHFITTAFIMILISLGYVATDIYLPSLPALAAYFGVGDNEVQMTLVSYMLSFSLTPLIIGPVSDHIGRKKVILAGLTVGLLASLACIFAQNIYWLIAARFFQGLGLGAVLIVARATVTDLFTGKELAKQMSLMTMLMPLIFAIAPMLGGILQEEFQWQSVFAFLILYTLPIIFWSASRQETVKELSHASVAQILRTYRSHLNNKAFLVYGLNFILPSIGMFSYMTTSPFLFQEAIGMSPAEYGALALYVGGTIIGTGYFNLKMIHHFSQVTMLYVGCSMMLLAGLLMLFFHFMGILTTWSVLLPTLIYFTCLPLCIANASAKSLSLVKGYFGAAAALLTTGQFLAGAFSSLIFSLIPDRTALPLALSYFLVGLISFLNLTYARSVEKHQNSPSTT